MSTSPVDKFGKIVITSLRDSAIDQHDLLVQGRCKAPSLAALQNQLKRQSPETLDLIRRCVINAVDAGMHDFLFALEEANDFDDVRVSVDGENVAELSDGLQGEPWSDEGWISKYGRHPEAEE